ncbi:hypothetical protein KGQ24_03555, partial [Patescibacteria group bacterium]|nr:hypothetical protein [Patescibacteria group bacterium]
MPDEKNENLNKSISLSEASELTGYHPDYLGYLARTGKLQAQKIGRSWVTTHDAIKGLMDKSMTMAEASELTGYHPDYLGYLARTGKLQAQKVGRSWMTTKAAVSDLMKQDKPNATAQVEVADESGQKIKVNIDQSQLKPELKPSAEVAEKLHALKLSVITDIARRQAHETAMQVLAGQAGVEAKSAEEKNKIASDKKQGEKSNGQISTAAASDASSKLVDKDAQKSLDEKLQSMQKELHTQMGAMLDAKISDAAGKVKQRDETLKQIYAADKPTLQVAHIMPTAKHAGEIVAAIDESAPSPALSATSSTSDKVTDSLG